MLHEVEKDFIFIFTILDYFRKCLKNEKKKLIIFYKELKNIFWNYVFRIYN